MTSDPRDRVVRRVKEALKGRTALEHPGPLAAAGSHAPVDAFRDRFLQNGGEVVGPLDDPREWLATFLAATPVRDASTPPSVATGNGVPADWIPGLPVADAEVAQVGISMARCAAADSGSVLLESSGGRRVQLLPPTHVVFVPVHGIRATLEEALEELHPTLPATLGVHSGPSKSADIGSTLVKGVHGPGRIIAVLVTDPPVR